MKTSQECRHWREVIRAWIEESAVGDPPTQVEEHLSTCVECRRYSEELRAATAGLRWLASRPAEPTQGFRARWTRAVERAAHPATLGDAIEALSAWCRGFLLRNLRPALGVASIWVLVLLFRLSAPAVSTVSSTAIARSPVEVLHALEADRPLLAWRHGWRPPQSAPRPSPRTEGLPVGPAAQRPEPEVPAAAGLACSEIIV